MSNEIESDKRFLVALSFPGEHRAFVAEVALLLSDELGWKRVLYDKFHEAEFARPNLDVHLQNLYHDNSTLVVVFMCADFDRKEWPGLEWRAIRDLIKKKQASSIMLVRLDDAEVSGIYSIDGYIRAQGRASTDIAALIIERLRIFEAERQSCTIDLERSPKIPHPIRRQINRGVALVKRVRELDCAERTGQDVYGIFQDMVFRGVTQRFRLIRSGRFMMGSPDEEPKRNENEIRHEVILSQDYWLADTAVTQALWEAVMEGNPCRFRGSERPVEQLNWDAAKGFIQRLNDERADLGLRLPTEAEWEYACRAGTESPFWFGAVITSDQTNYDGRWPYTDGGKWRCRDETVDVKAFPCNGWGLYQMHGNVWEWCADWFAAYEPGTATDPMGPLQGDHHVRRGGSYTSAAENCRSAVRDGPPVHYEIGFRLARDKQNRGGKAQGPGSPSREMK